ncbi:Spy/CpxP family protein refolding chaperone [Pelomonas cellulosilytica]|uniref:Periplasmic heavy metal sensor n=1 Tax=Pelomonas cellulosilytica TaxID=2906762 RepID=A0ABS8Y3J9_9BURK|nr:Spy/CpxP family protein refolding chaperone [Pelomonas sp. P8]MCE4557698.1 hypothetical protein [Pelomonas sp. P8]
MNIFRHWHAHHDFHHRHGGHGRRGHPFGDHAGGSAGHLVARAAARLDLDDDQQRRLATWLGQLQQQRDTMKSLASGPELAALVAGEQFARESAQQLLDARLDTLRAAGPGLIAAFADFFDALDAEQRQALRFMLRRFSHGRRRGVA